MKNKILFISLPILVLLYMSCNKISESIERDIIINDTSFFDIQPLDTVAPVTIPNIITGADLETEIREQAKSFTSGNIRSIKLNNLIIALNTTKIDTGNNLANLRAIKLSINSGGKTTTMGSTTITTKAATGNLALTVGISADSLRYHLANTPKTYSITLKAKKKTDTIMNAVVLTRYVVSLAK
ncbi:hypothetical protein [Pedobacter africanus]|uniref:Uncharacterized protein n=1 Tax=Pedobacter africanus TaxID=151894 RepID=A0A1W2DHA2_9SPHI|nr:hypothetical protein [Pedobacter africanus]SMC96308.1 hypothetical protein SAMN04488524_3757 [Pedobacter africanus]